jgi:UDP-arabinose 4-epimerase
MKRVLVTGGAGYIGSHTAKALAQNGIEPVVLDNLSMGHLWAVRWGPFVEGDIADSDLIRDTIRRQRIEGLIHFAANAYVGESIVEPRKYFQNNVANTLKLFDAAIEAGLRDMVFSSSCAVYGAPQRVPVDEEHPQSPVNPYGESKLFAERVLKWYAGAHGLRFVALRYFNAAGADPEGEIGESHDPETHLIPLAIGAALGQRPPLKIFGTDYETPDGTAVRDYVHVSDLADAHVRALDYLAHGGTSTAINLGTGSGHSVLDVARAVERVSGGPVPSEFCERRPGDPPALVARADKACEVLGWTPKFPTLEEIVGTAWKWHRAERYATATR